MAVYCPEIKYLRFHVLRLSLRLDAHSEIYPKHKVILLTIVQLCASWLDLTVLVIQILIFTCKILAHFYTCLLFPIQTDKERKEGFASFPESGVACSITVSGKEFGLTIKRKWMFNVFWWTADQGPDEPHLSCGEQAPLP